MPSHLKSKLDYAFVRSKRTGEVNIRRANERSQRSTSSLPSQELGLHYLGRECAHVCRCGNSAGHLERTYSVASESRHLSASITLYLDRHGLESCAIADFREYQRRREANWETQDVHVDDFHYASQNKNVVCRCSKPGNHDFGMPRNPKVVEQCAGFFCLYKGELAVTKQQWKGVDCDSPPAYSSGVQVQPDSTLDLLPGSFRDTRGKAQPPVSPGMGIRRTAERRAFFIPSCRHGALTPDRQAEMPPQVWQRARPSLWTARSSTQSALSTPMGSVPHSRPTSPPVAPEMTQRAPSSASRSQIQCGASANDEKLSSDASRVRNSCFDSAFDTSLMRSAVKSINDGALPKSVPSSQVPKAQATQSMPRIYRNTADLTTSPTGVTMGISIPNQAEVKASEVYEKDNDGTTSSRRSSPSNYDHWYRDHLRDQVYEKDEDQRSPSSSYNNRNMPVPIGFNDEYLAIRAQVAELPARRSPVELPVAHTRQRHTATLKELEGRDWDTKSELEVNRSRVRHQQATISMFHTARTTAGLSSRFEQTLDIATFSVPNQEEFLIRYAVSISLTDLVRAEDCQLCGEPYQIAQRCFLMMPGCGCSMHESCLLHDLRTLDAQFGRCPICGMILCQRTLTDRIDTDIAAIFGSQITLLETDVSIRFPRRSQVVTCSSEEGIAVAQLRLVKDYVDAHAAEVFRLWEANCAEPDWYAGVVRPVVELFQGWNPFVQSRLFVNNKAFLRLIAWAELVRLVNSTCAATQRTQGDNANFPQLRELHRKFALAKDRYNQEKNTWLTNCPGVFECDRIALDAIKIAMSTYKNYLN